MCAYVCMCLRVMCACVCACVCVSVIPRVLPVSRHRAILSVGHGFKLLTPRSIQYSSLSKVGGSQSNAEALQAGRIQTVEYTLCNLMLGMSYSPKRLAVQSLVMS